MRKVEPNFKGVLSKEDISFLEEHPLALAYLSVKAKDGFAAYSKSVMTNDVVNAVLSINRKTNNKYDAIVFQGIRDSGRTISKTSFDKSDVVALFKSSQFRLIAISNILTQ